MHVRTDAEGGRTRGQNRATGSGAHTSHECDAEYLYVLPGGLRSPGCLGYRASLGGSSFTLARTAHAAHLSASNPKHFDDAPIPGELKEDSTLSFSDQQG